MSYTNTKTKQEESVEYIFKERPALNGGTAFGILAGGGGALARNPHAGNALKSYKAAGNKKVAQAITQAGITSAASALLSQAAVNSVIDLTHTMQIAFSIARSIQDEEQAAFIEDYVRNMLNYLAVSHAHFLQMLRDQYDELIEQGVEPTWLDRVIAIFQ